MGESPMTVVAKACVGTEPLSEEDHLVLDAYFSSLLVQAASGRIVYDRMGADVPGWQPTAATNFDRMFRTEQGRNWFRHRLKAMHASGRETAVSVANFGEEMLQNAPQMGCSKALLSDLEG
jgi:hypothetical protein